MSTRATYTEDGWVAEVAILRDLCTADREAYFLEVVRTITPPPFFRPVADGTRFHCDQPRARPGLVFTLARAGETPPPEAHGFPELPREAPCLLGLALTALDRED